MKQNKVNHLGGLPFHLSLATLEWMSMHAALQSVNAGSPFSKHSSFPWANGSASAMPPLPHGLMPGLPPAANLDAWQSLLADPELQNALRNEGQRRFVTLLEGISNYKSAEYTRDIDEPECIATVGKVRLLRYAAQNAAKKVPALFIVPSLINRYYVLDLSKRLSMARYLQRNGVHVYIIDWDAPDEADAANGSEEYILRYVIPLLKKVRKEHREKLVLTGYCMGGLFALAAHLRAPELSDALALLATPWDFHTKDFPRPPFTEPQIAQLETHLNAHALLPADNVQMLFYAANPFVFNSKFREFSKQDMQSDEAHDFITIEHWVNDGVPLTRAMAKECFIDWVHRNKPAGMYWAMDGMTICPSDVEVPTFIAAPREDRIVPSSSALPLAKMIRASRLVQPGSGHVGMIVGSRRHSALWEPFLNWVNEVC